MKTPLLPLLAFLAMSGLAPAAVTLSNLTNNADFGATVAPGSWYAQSFTIESGATAPAFALESITINTDARGGGVPAGVFFVELWSAATAGDFPSFIPGDPREPILRLTGPTQPINQGENVYTATPTVTLSSGTSYFVVIGVENEGGQFGIAMTQDFASTGEPGWEFGRDIGSGITYSGYHVSSNFGGTWQSGSILQASTRVKLSIEATPVPEPSMFFLLLATSALAFRQRRR